MAQIIGFGAASKKREILGLRSELEHEVAANQTAAICPDHINHYGLGVHPRMVKMTTKLLSADVPFAETFGRMEMQVLKMTVYDSLRLQVRPFAASAIDFKQKALLGTAEERAVAIRHLDEIMDVYAISFSKPESEEAKEVQARIARQHALFTGGWRESIERLHEERSRDPFTTIRGHLDELGLGHPIHYALPDMSWQQDGTLLDPANPTSIDVRIL